MRISSPRLQGTNSIQWVLSNRVEVLLTQGIFPALAPYWINRCWLSSRKWCCSLPSALCSRCLLLQAPRAFWYSALSLMRLPSIHWRSVSRLSWAHATDDYATCFQEQLGLKDQSEIFTAPVKSRVASTQRTRKFPRPWS